MTGPTDGTPLDPAGERPTADSSTHSLRRGLVRPVLLVRPDGNETDLAALAAVGVPGLAEPYLTVAPVPDAGPASRLLAALNTAGAGDWLVVTSPRTMAAWGALVGEEALARAVTAARERGVKTAAVGDATAATLDAPPEMIGTSGAAELVAELKRLPPGAALLPQSRIAGMGLALGLADAGWRVQSSAVYDTVAVTTRPASAGALSAGNLSGVLLRSPSAADAVARWATIPPGVRVFAVGPTTTRAAERHGWEVISLAVAEPDEIASQIAAVLAGGGDNSLPVGRNASAERRAEQRAGTYRTHSVETNRSADPMPADYRSTEPPPPGAPDHPLPADHPLLSGLTADSPLIAAYRGRPHGRRPIWFMRQAGRSLPEYRALREGRTMLDSCLDPELAAEITLQPVRRHDVDAAVFFSDIVIPVRLAGVDVEIAPGVGPVVERPIATRADVDALPELDPDALAPIRDAVGIAVAELGATPLIGFAGAPFTVASYLVEGRPSRTLPRTRALLRDDPDTWHALLAWVARTTTAFLRAQAIAGASALQLFDSWAGRLTPAEYASASAPHSAAVLAGVADLGLPRVHFGTQTRDLLVAMRDAGADVMGVDSDTPLDEANALLGGRTPLQGNIDPGRLAAPWPTLAEHAADVVRRGRAAPGHVVNLGHGVPPDADPDVLTRLVAFVHELPEEES